MTLPKTITAAVASTPKAPLEFKQFPMPTPSPGEVLVKILACGVCHSDMGVINGEFGPLPRVPGHEFVGDVVQVGEGVTRVKLGDRVGGAWHGGHDNSCSSCAIGMFQCCTSAAVNGVTRDGGYATYTLLRAEAAVRIPASMAPSAVAPLLCAGVTVFNSLRKLHVEQGALVAVQGLGGLGHLAVQYARAMGYTVAAVSRGESKREFAKKLGAEYYIDSSAEDVSSALMKLGGAAVIMCTAPSASAINPLIGGLAVKGTLLLLAVAFGVEIDAVQLIQRAASIQGWPSGSQCDTETAIAFAQRYGIKAMVEEFKLEQANEALESMTQSKVRFRAVLVME
ncbi:hypothetical protein TD95_002906 [Thielaviopsis punctulata]|uniref:Enoyl reductase (ER) domain-containing protein n=1 Tax=Thielaviopsis punctulata TaxID=72032 RepID=A0A0F4ZEB4_9PEZI|nr:hypothetical protein TD95_002906 [Thielaviopsis punctulata]